MTDEAPLTIRRAACRAIFVFDVGREIDLAACRKLVPDLALATEDVPVVATPTSLHQDAPPLRIDVRCEPFDAGGCRADDTAEVAVYDYGAMAVTLCVPTGKTLEALRDTACVLAGNVALAAAARAVAMRLLDRIAASVANVAVAVMHEDYAVFEVTDFEARVPLEKLTDSVGAEFAQILRAEPDALSTQEVANAVSSAVARTPDDLVVVDWNAALVFHRSPQTVRHALELANVQLLEMRFVDLRLNEAVRHSYDVVSSKASWRPAFMPDSIRNASRRIARSQVEAAIRFERISNALKLVGDQYLSRVYRAAVRRLDLVAWSDANSRKLATLEGIYDKVQDRAAGLRAETMEWIVMVLVILSMVLPFLKR